MVADIKNISGDLHLLLQVVRREETNKQQPTTTRTRRTNPQAAREAAIRDVLGLGDYCWFDVFVTSLVANYFPLTMLRRVIS
jgi:hypothetical protein